MLLSVIIPAYNAEKYIKNTLSKIFDKKADFKYEVIVINDGSLDKTEAKLQTLKKKYSNLVIKSIKNSGPSGARNEALKIAKGEYIMFCDSDDGLKKNSISEIMNNVIKSKPDLYIFGFDIINDSGNSFTYSYPNSTYTKDEFLNEIHNIYAKNVLNQVWGKVLKRSIIIDNNIQFYNTRWGEDRIFLFDYIKHAKTFEITEKSYYLYYQNAGSLITSYVADKFDVCIKIDSSIRKLSKNKEIESKEIFDYMFIKSVISTITMLFSPKCNLSYREKRAFVKKIITNDAVTSKKVYPKNCGKAFLILANILKTKNISLILFFMRIVYFASGNMSNLFIKLKHKMN